MPATPVLMKRPKQTRNSKILAEIPDLDATLAVLEQTQPGDGNVVGVTDPQEKEGTARNIARAVADLIMEHDPTRLIRTHTGPTGSDPETFIGAISYKPEPKQKKDKTDDSKGAKQA